MEANNVAPFLGQTHPTVTPTSANMAVDEMRLDVDMDMDIDLDYDGEEVDLDITRLKAEAAALEAVRPKTGPNGDK